MLSDPIKRREYDQNKKQIENDPNYTIRVEEAMFEKVREKLHELEMDFKAEED